MPPHLSCSRRRDPTTSRRYFANYIGWRFQRGSSSGSACWPIGVCTTPHRHPSPTRYNRPVMWMLDDVFAALIPWHWLNLRRVVQRWEIERWRCQLHGHGTPCRLASELHRHSLRFGRSLNNHFFLNHFLTSDWWQRVVQCPCNSLWQRHHSNQFFSSSSTIVVVIIIVVVVVIIIISVFSL